MHSCLMVKSLDEIVTIRRKERSKQRKKEKNGFLYLLFSEIPNLLLSDSIAAAQSSITRLISVTFICLLFVFICALFMLIALIFPKYIFY